MSKEKYNEKLREANLDTVTVTRNNSNRFSKILRKLELAGKEQSCIVCGARTFRDSAVVIRPGFWAAPRSFHKDGCALDEFMREAHAEIVAEETAQEKIWNATEGRRIVKEVSASVKKLLDKMKPKEGKDF